MTEAANAPAGSWQLAQNKGQSGAPQIRGYVRDRDQGWWPGLCSDHALQGSYINVALLVLWDGLKGDARAFGHLQPVLNQLTRA